MSTQILRNPPKDGSVTFALRVRRGGVDVSVPLGNSSDGWEEVRVDAARRQLLAKIELGLWTPGEAQAGGRTGSEEPTVIAAGWDIPYVQAQVGHVDPTTTLGIYAQLMARPDRDELRSDLRALLGVSRQQTASDTPRGTNLAPEDRLGRIEKAAKGSRLLP